MLLEVVLMACHLDLLRVQEALLLVLLPQKLLGLPV